MGFLVTLLVGRGLSALAAKAIIYAVLSMVIGGVLLGIRQHYVNKGWYAHEAAVKKQDGKAINAGKEVERRTDKCTEENGFWDVITQNCKLQEEEKK